MKVAKYMATKHPGTVHLAAETLHFKCPHLDVDKGQQLPSSACFIPVQCCYMHEGSAPRHVSEADVTRIPSNLAVAVLSRFFSR